MINQRKILLSFVMLNFVSSVMQGAVPAKYNPKDSSMKRMENFLKEINPRRIQLTSGLFDADVKVGSYLYFKVKHSNMTLEELKNLVQPVCNHMAQCFDTLTDLSAYNYYFGNVGLKEILIHNVNAYYTHNDHIKIALGSGDAYIEYEEFEDLNFVWTCLGYCSLKQEFKANGIDYTVLRDKRFNNLFSRLARGYAHTSNKRKYSNRESFSIIDQFLAKLQEQFTVAEKEFFKDVLLPTFWFTEFLMEKHPNPSEESSFSYYYEKNNPKVKLLQFIHWRLTGEFGGKFSTIVGQDCGSNLLSALAVLYVQYFTKKLDSATLTTKLQALIAVVRSEMMISSDYKKLESDLYFFGDGKPGSKPAVSVESIMALMDAPGVNEKTAQDEAEKIKAAEVQAVVFREQATKLEHAYQIGLEKIHSDYQAGVQGLQQNMDTTLRQTKMKQLEQQADAARAELQSTMAQEFDDLVMKMQQGQKEIERKAAQVAQQLKQDQQALAKAQADKKAAAAKALELQVEKAKQHLKELEVIDQDYAKELDALLKEAPEKLHQTAQEQLMQKYEQGRQELLQTYQAGLATLKLELVQAKGADQQKTIEDAIAKLQAQTSAEEQQLRNEMLAKFKELAKEVVADRAAASQAQDVAEYAAEEKAIAKDINTINSMVTTDSLSIKVLSLSLKSVFKVTTVDGQTIRVGADETFADALHVIALHAASAKDADRYVGTLYLKWQNLYPTDNLYTTDNAKKFKFFMFEIVNQQRRAAGLDSFYNSFKPGGVSVPAPVSGGQGMLLGFVNNCRSFAPDIAKKLVEEKIFVVSAQNIVEILQKNHAKESLLDGVLDDSNEMAYLMGYVQQMIWEMQTLGNEPQVVVPSAPTPSVHTASDISKLNRIVQVVKQVRQA